VSKQTQNVLQYIVPITQENHPDLEKHWEGLKTDVLEAQRKNWRYKREGGATGRTPNIKNVGSDNQTRSPMFITEAAGGTNSNRKSFP